MSIVEIENIGPVTHASIPVPESGGVVVLRGRNGAGKTRTLDAVENLISGRGKPSVRDGALSGSVNGFGVTLNIARSARRSGELEVTSLDGRLSVAELVDPGLKSPDAADAKRIKALIAVAGIKPSADMFYGLFGGRDQFEAIASSAAVESSDLVAMADRIKRDCESEARKAESEADHEEGRARGAMEAAGDVADGEDDSETLQSALESAIASKSKIQQQVEASRAAKDAAELAQHRIDKSVEAAGGVSLGECRQLEGQARSSRNEAEMALVAAKKALENAQKAFDDARMTFESAEAKLQLREDATQAALRHESTIQQWREQVEADIPPMPDPEEVKAAIDAVAKARAAVERGAVIRAAKAKRAEAEKHAQKALAARKWAAELRQLGKGTDDVLSDAVSKAGSPLKVQAGRLVLSTKRGDTYFAELSHGERWRIALDVAIQAVGKGGVIVLQQEAWEGLDPIAREAIVDQVKGSEVVILTAECSAQEGVTAEVF